MSTGSALLDRPPRDALDLNESVHLLVEGAASILPADRFQPEPGSVFDAQGRVPIIIIRPGIGRGRGRHLYEAEMLRENADKFSGWKMFIDHLSPDARRAAGGLPRSIRDLGGRIEEAWYEDAIPADPERGYGEGAVVGLAKPVPFVRELIENDPEIIESSISASATNVRPVVRDGQRVWLVEGIEDKGTVDWVTEAGAGGRVIPLMESVYATEEGVDMALLESMSNEDFQSYVEENRPELLEAVKGKKGEGDEDGMAEKVAEFEKKGLPHAAAVNAAKKALSEATTPEGGTVADTDKITKEQLQEALHEQPEALAEALQQSSEAQLFISGLVEAKLEGERELIEAKAEEKAQRIVNLVELRDEAHSQIQESKLPESWQKGLRDKYSLQEGGKPTSALDVQDETDDDDKVTKSASKVLSEAVGEDIKGERARLAEAAPTRVRGQHPTTPEPDENGDPQPLDAKKTGWGQFLQESAQVDPNKAFALKGAGEDA